MKKNYTLIPMLGALILLCSNARAQQTYTFTNCGATGSVGPTQTMVDNTYTLTNLMGGVGTTSTGIQTWTVPYTGNFRITCIGASGGTSSASSYTEGAGATMIGDFALIGGEVLHILVGQMGENGSSTAPGGGGGGSFVVRAPYTSTANALIVAGGGSGAGTYSSAPGLTTTTGGSAPSGGAGGSNGSGGAGGGRAAGGGGFLTDGGPCTVNTAYSNPGQAFVNGGRGGGKPNNATCSGTYVQITQGGFGGGASHGGNCIPNGGAGGGFSGGGGSYNAQSAGGGSINQGTNQLNTSGNNVGHGKVLITELCSVKIITSASGTLNPVNMCSGTSVTLTTDAVSGYSWSTGATSSSIVLSPTSNTVISVTGTSSLNCTATGVMSLNVSSGLPVLSITNPSNNICMGKMVTLTASGANSYTWANAGVVNGVPFAPASTAVYTVAGQNGCGVTTATTAITVSPLAVNTLATPSVVCQGEASTLTAVSATGNYTWQPGGIIGNNIVVSPSAGTIYTVTASDGTCAGTQTVEVNTIVSPTITTSQTLISICQGESINLSATGAGPGGTYTWTPGGTGANITLAPNTSTNVIVAGTNSLNCTSTAQQIILVDQAPNMSVSANKNLVCTGDPIVLTASGAQGYQWTGGPAAASYTVTQTAASSVYTVVGSHTQNTCTATRTIAVGALIPDVAYSSSLSVCEGGSVTFTASGATSYTWNGQNTGSTGAYLVSPSSSGIYTLVANTSSAGVNCLTTNFATLTLNPNPTITVTPAKETICKGETHTLTASGAVTYSWSVSPGTGSVVTVKPASNTFYNVTGVDENGCEGSLSYIAKVNPCTGIMESGIKQTIAVYPNPTSGDILISAEGDITLELVNGIGQHLRSIKLDNNNQHKMQVNDLPPGVYYLVGENSSERFIEKIIVTK